VPAGRRPLIQVRCGRASIGRRQPGPRAAPAFVQDRHLNVLAANPVAQVLSPNMRPGVNRLLAAFLDPAEKDLH